MTFRFPHEVVETGDGDGLDELHAEASTLTPGYTFDYRGYTLEKVDTGAAPDHTEFFVVTPHGAHVETISVGAYDSPARLRAFLNRVVAYAPDSMRDWLDREEA